MGEHRSTIRPVLRLESALLRFFEQFGFVLRSQFNYFLEERWFLRCIELGRRSGTRRNRCSYLFEELFLACRRADAKHPASTRRYGIGEERSLECGSFLQRAQYASPLGK